MHPLAIFFFKRSPTIGSPFQFTRINSLVLVGLTMPMNQENSYGQISESRLFFSLERTLKMTLKSFCPKLLKWCTRGTVKNKVRYSFYFLENNEPSFYFLPKKFWNSRFLSIFESSSSFENTFFFLKDYEKTKKKFV